MAEAERSLKDLRVRQEMPAGCTSVSESLAIFSGETGVTTAIAGEDPTPKDIELSSLSGLWSSVLRKVGSIMDAR